jgi:hypothetical protein
MCDLPLFQIKFSLVPISITSLVSLSPLDDLIIRDKILPPFLATACNKKRVPDGQAFCWPVCGSAVLKSSGLTQEVYLRVTSMCCLAQKKNLGNGSFRSRTPRRTDGPHAASPFPHDLESLIEQVIAVITSPSLELFFF